MSEEIDAETQELLSRLPPPIAALMCEMMARRPADWSEAHALRNRIVQLNKGAATDDEQSSLCFAFNSLMDYVEQAQLVDSASLNQLRQLRKADYKMLLNQQALVGDLIDPTRLSQVTLREVEAGRMDTDDEFRKYAEAAGEVLGKPQPPKPNKGWLAKILGGS